MKIDDKIITLPKEDFENLNDNLLAILVDKDLDLQKFTNFLFIGFGEYATITRPQISISQLLYCIAILNSTLNKATEDMPNDEVEQLYSNYNNFLQKLQAGMKEKEEEKC